MIRKLLLMIGVGALACPGYADTSSSKPEIWRQLVGHNDAVHAIAFAPGTSEYLVSVGRDGEAIMWDVTSQRILWRTKLPDAVPSDYYTVQFSNDGKSLFVGSIFQLPLMIRATDGAVVRRFALPSSLDKKPSSYCIALSKDGQYLAAADYGNRRIHLWDVDSGVLAAALTDNAEIVRSMVFSGSQGLLAAVGEHTVSVWRVVDQKLVRSFGFPAGPDNEGYHGTAKTAVLAPDFSYILATGSITDIGDDVALIDMETGLLAKRWVMLDDFDVLRFSDDMSEVCGFSGFNVWDCWKVPSGESTYHLHWEDLMVPYPPFPEFMTPPYAFSGDLRYFATAENAPYVFHAQDIQIPKIRVWRMPAR